jgi:hypothetical protein
MEAEFRHMIVSVILVCLFSLSILMFAIGLGGEYGKDTSDMNSDIINLSGINNTLNSAEITAKTWQSAFTTQKTVLGQASIILTGLFGLGQTMWNVMISPIYLFIFMLQNVLGFPAVVSGVIIFLVIIAFIFSLWRLLRIADT